MPVSYRKLFALMETKQLKKYDLRKAGINPKVVDALQKNNNVNVSTIMQLCEILNCQPGDLMEYVPDIENQ